MFKEFGTILTLTGAEILTGFTPGVPLAVYAGRSKRVRFTFKLVTKAGTAITAATIKIEASDDDGVTWYGFGSEGDTDEIYAPLIEHPYALADGSTAVKSLVAPGGVGRFRASIKATGGVGADGDIFTVSARSE